MNHCRTCKFYESERTTRHGTFGKCELTRSGDGEPVFADSLAVADDMESYSAVLRVSPEFGCVQWQDKGASEPAYGWDAVGGHSS